MLNSNSNIHYAFADPFYNRRYSHQNRWTQEVHQYRYMTMLWNQTKQLPKEAFNLVEEKYKESGFFLEVRLQLPVFVESNFMPNADVDETTAVNLATQLLSQLEAKIASIPNDPDKYKSKTKLDDNYDSL